MLVCQCETDLERERHEETETERKRETEKEIDLRAHTISSVQHDQVEIASTSSEALHH